MIYRITSFYTILKILSSILYLRTEALFLLLVFIPEVIALLLYVFLSTDKWIKGTLTPDESKYDLLEYFSLLITIGIFSYLTLQGSIVSILILTLQLSIAYYDYKIHKLISAK